MIILTEKDFVDKFKSDVIETFNLINKIDPFLCCGYGRRVEGQLEKEKALTFLLSIGYSRSDNKVVVYILRNPISNQFDPYQLKLISNHYIIYTMPNEQKIKEILKMKAFA